ncbi:MAG: LPS assembly lipoprotein LptE [Chthoniobacterales bacterium]|nr:LPS assembly lipoprotein LptE [Chthoniobacterales bacterium]
MFKIFSPTLFFFLLLCSCGYQLGEIRPTPLRSVKTLAIRIIKNETYIPRANSILTDSIISAIQADGTFSVSSPEKADAILHGVLVRSERAPIRSAVSNYLQTTEYELTLELRYEIRDRLSNNLLHSGTIQASSNFFPTGDLTTDERQALAITSQKLASKFVRSISEGY